ncbi:MAG TPA: STAS domain-containing protein [Magnetospirillum sp.]|nr:STAS domain-containing protein [Magnetospirillum sp.]
MAINVSKIDDVTIISLVGRLDSNSAGEGERTVAELLDGGVARLALDFTNLDHISSAGLRVVLVAAKRIKAAAGKLVIFGMQNHVREVFEMSGFLVILTVCPDRDSALAALAG